MTCIVSLKEKNKIYIGGDSCAVGGYSVAPVADSKVFRLSPTVLVGYAGSFRGGQILQYSTKLPKHSENKTDHEYLCIDFVKAIQKAFEKNGFDGHNKRTEKEMDANFIITYNGQIYEIDTDFHVSSYVNNFTSIGIGSDLAIGAMYALEKSNSKLPPEEKIRIALDAASEFNGGVMPPYNIMSVSIK